MSKIIQIDKLYDNCHEMNFGYIGIDLETRKRKYYSYYNLNHEYSCENLYEFDPNNLDGCSKIGWHMYHCNHKCKFSWKIAKRIRTISKRN